MIGDDPDEEDQWQESKIFKQEFEEFKLDSDIDVNQELVVDNPKSMFVLAHTKIEVESIYDNNPQKVSKTRFGNLPTKYEKTNMPVTFHKNIKSSGYSAAPGSLKYISKEKKKE